MTLPETYKPSSTELNNNTLQDITMDGGMPKNAYSIVQYYINNVMYMHNHRFELSLYCQHNNTMIMIVQL